VEAVNGDEGALGRRADAARDLVATGLLEPALALSFVVWPSAAVDEASRTGPRPSQDRVADAVELVAEGVGQARAGEAFGVGRYPIQETLRERDLQMRLRV
jgi:hypothetical protein